MKTKFKEHLLHNFWWPTKLPNRSKKKGRVAIRAQSHILANITTTNGHGSCHKKHKRLNRLLAKDSSSTRRSWNLHCKTRKQSFFQSEATQMHNNVHIASCHMRKKADRETNSGICTYFLPPKLQWHTTVSQSYRAKTAASEPWIETFIPCDKIVLLLAIKQLLCLTNKKDSRGNKADSLSSQEEANKQRAEQQIERRCRHYRLCHSGSRREGLQPRVPNMIATAAMAHGWKRVGGIPAAPFGHPLHGISLGLVREEKVPALSLEPLVEQERVNNGPLPMHPLEGIPHKWAEGRALTGPQHKLAARFEHVFGTIAH